MLSTLHKIGEQLLEGQGIWARLTTEPKYEEKKKNWICPILFDCVNSEIKILNDDMELFKPEESSINYRYVNPDKWGRRGKKCALTVEVKNFSMLEETLFGLGKGQRGSMMRSIQEFDSNLTETTMYKALQEIHGKLSGYREYLDLKQINEQLDLGKEEEVVLFYSLVKSDQIKGAEPTRLNSLEGYEDFIIGKFGPEDGAEGLDYITGNFSKDASVAKFNRGYNPNAVFQTTVSNYASGFSDFKKTFQSDSNTVAALDKAGSYALRRLQKRIAGISHIVIPSFMHKDLADFDLSETELFLDHSTELLFDFYSLESGIDRDLPLTELFWVNYIAFESDGNSFKIINHIKDVNSEHLKNVIGAFNLAGKEFKNYIGSKYAFNLQSIYTIIPIRDGDNSKNNHVLNLFKDILEQRLINCDPLYKYFLNNVKCHRHGQFNEKQKHRAFPNIRKNESFDFAIKDAVFKYSGLFYALKQLNLIDMEQEKSITIDYPESSKSEFQERMDKFFVKMNYSEKEKAMFYLGRVLSSIAYAQYKKGHESKPVLNKINFNGIDAQAIIRLSLDLAEKSRQYGIHVQTDWDFARFREKFNEKNWPLSNEQNVFYLMAGYSFGLIKSDNN